MFAVQAVNVSTFSPLIAPIARKHREALVEQNDPHPDPLPSDGVCVYRGASARVTHGVFGALAAAVRAGRPPVERLKSTDPKVPIGTTESSPRFQPWVARGKRSEPQRATEEWSRAQAFFRP